MKVIAFPKLKAEEPDEPLTGEPLHALDEEKSGIDRITVRVITVALVLSLFIHAVLLLTPLFHDTKPASAPGEELGPLQARIEPAPKKAQPQPQAQTPPQAQPEPQPRPDNEPPPAKAVTKTRPTPAPPRARITTQRPSPISVPPPVQVAPAPPTPAPEVPRAAPAQPPAEDLASLIEQRRRARGAPPQGEAVESDDDRAKRIALGNIQAQQKAASPEMVDGGGGLFRLDRTGLTDADFVFNGWSTDFKRNTGVTVHVRVGNDPDIRVAVIRRMIQIIRERKPGDFEWYSYKRGKSVTMSARPQDSQRLEAFLMHEFYPDDPRGRDAR